MFHDFLQRIEGKSRDSSMNIAMMSSADREHAIVATGCDERAFRTRASPFLISEAVTGMRLQLHTHRT